MIVVDTSALMAIVLDEPKADACIAVLEAEDEILISAGTMAEALIVSARRNVREEASARRIAQAYERWGKGIHPAALNFGDCFAYEAAKEHACRLLYVGDDFSKTDIESAL
jgi:ribonuclease VapC